MAKKGAQSGGGGKANRRAKDSATAAYMKRHNIHRETTNCPICHRPVSIPFNSWDRHRCGSR